MTWKTTSRMKFHTLWVWYLIGPYFADPYLTPAHSTGPQLYLTRGAPRVKKMPALLLKQNVGWFDLTFPKISLLVFFSLASKISYIKIGSDTKYSKKNQTSRVSHGLLYLYLYRGSIHVSRFHYSRIKNYKCTGILEQIFLSFSRIHARKSRLPLAWTPLGPLGWT